MRFICVQLFLFSLMMVVLNACKAHAPEPAPPAAEAVAEDTPTKDRTLEEGFGELRFNSLPWANVTVDGKPSGRTGRSVKLPTGVHNVVLTTSDGRVHKMVLTVENQQVNVVCWNFDLGKPCRH